MKHCQFCHEYKFVNEITKDNEFVEHKLYVKLACLSFKKGIEKIPENHCGMTTYGSMTLNFCPECGNKL